MGKKATAKLLQKVKKKNATPMMKNGGGKPQKRKNAETLSTQLNRLQKRQKMKKRQRPSNNDQDVDAEEAAELEQKRLKKKDWIKDHKLTTGAEPKFDKDKAGATKSAKKKKASSQPKKEMDVDTFLAGGFNDLDDSEEEEDDDAAANQEMDQDDDDEESVYSDGEETVPEEDDDDDQDDDESEDDMASHKKDLERLKETDPEFYKHLTQHGKELLNFGDDDEDEDEASDDEDQQQPEDDDDTASPASKKSPSGRPILTGEVFKSICHDALKKKTDKGLRSLVSAFRAGCHIADPEGMESDDNMGLTNQYEIVSSAVFQKLMITCLKNLHLVFHKKLGIKKPTTTADDQEEDVTKAALVRPRANKRWRKYQSLVKSFLTNLIHILGQSTDASMLKFLIQSSRHYMCYFLAFPKTLAKKYLKCLLEHWGNSEDGSVRVAAFLRIRQLAVMAGRLDEEELFEQALKGAYLTFVKGSKFSTANTIDRIAMQAKCLVELFGLDLGVSYQLGFVYIRQLALHLRSAISSKSVEGVKNVYSWQYIHCLRVWGAILCAYPGMTLKNTAPSQKEKASTVSTDQEQLRALIYPLVQVIIGVIRLVPTPRNFPVRLHAVSILVSIAKSSRMFIPITPLVLDILQNPELFSSKPVASTSKPPEMEHALRLNKDILQTAQCQDILVNKSVELIRATMECYRHTIGFPELAHPTVVALRAFTKKTRATRWRNSIRALIQTINAWSTTVQQKRNSATFAPKDVSRMNTFLDEDRDAMLFSKAKEELRLDAPEEATKQAPVDEDESEESMDEDVEVQDEVSSDEEEEGDDGVVQGEGDDVVGDLQMSDSSDDEE